MTEKLSQALYLIKKDFILDSEALPRQVTTTDELKKRLMPIVNDLLNRDMPGLLNALYRIDVSEKKVKHVLAVEEPGNLATCLTDLIISRELAKVSTRMQYKNQSL